MTIEKKHPEYIARMKGRSRCRDAIAGQDAVHQAGTKYLPKLSAMSTTEYNAYKLRSQFFGATERTHEAMSGLMFFKTPTEQYPDGMDEIINDVDMAGRDSTEFAEHISEEILATGRVALWANHTGTPGEDMSRAQAEATGQRPVMHAFTDEQIHDWKEGTIEGTKRVTFLKIWEVITVPTTDEWIDDTINQYRVLDLDGAGDYRVRLFRHQDNGHGKKEWVQFGTDMYPERNGERFRYVPATIIDLGKPPLQALADVNFSHYRSSASLEHGAHFTALPTPYVAGLNTEAGGKFKLRLGSSEGINLKETGSAGYMEFRGEGLKTLERLMDRKEEHMAVLGGRMLAPEKRAVESADGQAIRQNGENSALSKIAEALSDGIEYMLKILAEWHGLPSEEVQFKVSKDYAPNGLSAQQLTAMLGAVQGGRLSPEAFTFNIKRAGLLEDDVAVEDELDRIAEQAPPLATAFDPLPSRELEDV